MTLKIIIVVILLLIPSVTYRAILSMGGHHGASLLGLVIIPIVATVIWWFVFAGLYKTTRSRAARLALWLLAPMGLWYPAFWVVMASCALFFNWCGGAPL